MLGVVVVATILAGFTVAKVNLGRRLVWTATAAAAAFGLAVAFIDIREARATEELAEAVVDIARRENPHGQTWFAGAWAFEYYALKNGLQPLDPNRSELQAGDLVVLVEQQLNRVDFHPGEAPLSKLHTVEATDNMPWCTVLCYYCGSAPIRHHEGPRLRATVYRVNAGAVLAAHGTLPGVH